MSIVINVTYGGAGTGKTTALVNDVKTLGGRSYIILSPTHSSLRNLTDKLTSEQGKNAKTVYSYFQIDYENDHVVGPNKIVKHVFIDEFGLIKKELFKQIINKTSIALHKFIDTNRIPDFNINFYIYGDPVQLSPIYTTKRKISFTSLARYEIDSHLLPSFVIEHDYNSLFSLKVIREATKKLLTVNYRSNDDVLQIVRKLFYENDLSVIKYIDQMEVARLIVNEGYVFISSKYDLHTSIYRLVQTMLVRKYAENEYKLMNELMFYPGSRFLVAETSVSHKNGEYVTFDHISGDKVFLKSGDAVFEYSNKLKLLPEFLITAHKSQGLTIPNVIVCTDNLFDISMLYTMITRASKSVLFFSNTNPDLTSYVANFRSILQYYNYV